MAGTGAFLLALALVSPAVASPAQDVADVSDKVCYALASATLSLPGVNAPGDASGQQKTVEALGLTYGIDNVAMDGLGRVGQTIVSRSTMASKVNGGSRTVATIGAQGCRVLLVADANASLPEQVASALLARGWKAGPPAGLQSPAVTRRMFLRRDGTGKVYLLNLMVPTVPEARLQLFTTIAAIPPNVALPKGF